MGVFVEYIPTARGWSAGDTSNLVTRTGGLVTISSLTYSIYCHVSGNSTINVNELSNNIDFSVFPNPSSDLFNINLDAKTTEDALPISLNVSGQVKEVISLANYDKRIYFLTIDNNKDKRTVKLIFEQLLYSCLFKNYKKIKSCYF